MDELTIIHGVEEEMTCADCGGTVESQETSLGEDDNYILKVNVEYTCKSCGRSLSVIQSRQD